MMKIIGYQYKAWKHIRLILHRLTEFAKYVYSKNKTQKAVKNTDARYLQLHIIAYRDSVSEE